MKSWPEPIRFSRSPTAVTATAEGYSAGLEQRIQERERLAMEKGRAEAGKFYGEQLIRQRADLADLQNGILGAMKDAVPQVMAGCERHLVELAMEVARKLVDGFPITVEMIEQNIRSAMQQVEESAHYTILINPEDLQLMERAGSSVLAPSQGAEVLLQPSKEIARGGCVVETPFGRVDARRETKYQLLRGALLN